MFDKLGAWKYGVILIGIVLLSLVVLGVNFISNESEDSKTDDIDHPDSNLFVTLTLKNFTYNNALIHNDQVKITISIRNSSNSQSIQNIRFNLFVHRLFVKYMPELGYTDSKNIDYLLESPLITNELGIAISTIKYSHDTLPVYFGWGKLEINTTTYPNTNALSELLMFNYMNITEQRKSGHSEGINIIKRLEMRDILNESKEIISPDNAYRNLSIYYSTVSYSRNPYKTINKTSIEYYKDQITFDDALYFLEVDYFAYAIPLNYSNLNMMVLEYILEEMMNVKYQYHWSDRPKTGELSDITFTTGWIIFQQLKHSRAHDRDSGSDLRIQQVLILDTNETILWMMSDYNKSVA
ncbi:MAG: hypothetical protein ACXAC7_00315 [Candidatus Hodarchaeales archaeon]|jgi:hypothetical protein